MPSSSAATFSFLSNSPSSPFLTITPLKSLSQNPLPLPKLHSKLPNHGLSIKNTLPDFSKPATLSPLDSIPPPPSFGPDQPPNGADVLVQALDRAGVSVVFAYPGGATVEIHQALTRCRSIHNVLCRHEQGEVFAAEAYARASGCPGVCIATSGPGAANLVSGLADAFLDSVPLVAITGQVSRSSIGTDAFQDISIVDITRSITKHNYLVMDVMDIPRIVAEAFFISSTGRPGPVLIDVPKDIQQQLVVPDWNRPFKLPGYISLLPKPPPLALLEQIMRLISESRRPVLYVGGGCLDSSKELRRFVWLTGIPVASTLMGLGAFPVADELSLRMLGMHGTVYANYAIDRADLLLAFGVRFDDRVTGKVEAFASRAKIVHIDIDRAEIGKNKKPHFSICTDVKMALEGLNALLETKRKPPQKLRFDFSAWKEELEEQKKKFPLSYKTFGDAIPPQCAIQTLDELTNSDAIITTGVGQHQMWAAQWYNYRKPRQWVTSSGFGAMGFGLPAAIGAARAAPGTTVVDIDGDGSFIMNIQELATVAVENLDVKVMVLNNQHLGMVVQFEDTFFKANRGHSYLGMPGKEAQIFPDFLKFAEGCGIPAARVARVGEVREAIQKMLETPGPYVLDIIVPHQVHVLPMIPSGGSFQDLIFEDDGRSSY